MDREPSAGSERRQRILNATERLLDRYGPGKTTIADIAREAEVAVGTVYLEFDSKDAIILAISGARYEGVLDAMRHAATQPGCCARVRLQGVLDARVEAFLAAAEAGGHACDLLHCQSRAVQAAHERFLGEERALLGSLLREGASTGELDVPDVELAASTLLRAYMSFSPPWLFKTPRDVIPGQLAAMHALVLHGLVRRP